MRQGTTHVLDSSVEATRRRRADPLFDLRIGDSIAQDVVLTHDVAKGRSWPQALLPQLFPRIPVRKVVAATTTASKRVTASTKPQKSPTATKPARGGKSASKPATNTEPVESDVATPAARGVDGCGVESPRPTLTRPTLEADENVDVLLEESAELAAAAEVEPEDEERRGRRGRRRTSPGTTRRSPRRSGRPARTPS